MKHFKPVALAILVVLVSSLGITQGTDEDFADDEEVAEEDDPASDVNAVGTCTTDATLVSAICAAYLDGTQTGLAKADFERNHTLAHFAIIGDALAKASESCQQSAEWDEIGVQVQKLENHMTNMNQIFQEAATNMTEARNALATTGCSST